MHSAGMFEIGVTAEEMRRMRRTYVDGTDIVLEAALELGVPRTVYVSSIVAFGDSGRELRDEIFKRQTWLEVLEAERQLKERRNGAGPLARLKPLDELHSQVKPALPAEEMVLNGAA